jgi:hypothetical protein
MVRIDRQDDGDTAQPDDADPADADWSGVRETSPASSDAATRTERSLEHRAGVDAKYRAYAIDRGCARVEQIESGTVTPVMLRIEAEEPDRHLAGLDHRLKERDRIEEKVRHDIEKRGATAEDAFAVMKDAIRYSYCYNEDGYSSGVLADCERIKSAGSNSLILETGGRTTSTKVLTLGGGYPRATSCSRCSFIPRQVLMLRRKPTSPTNGSGHCLPITRRFAT